MPTKNPHPWEVDESLPEPDQESWSLIKITVERTDGGIVDAELIRPKSWINSNSLAAGKALPLNLPELEVGGLATVTSIERCPEIASVEGSVVTARFLTREVHVIARVEVLAADGRLETIEGTLIHPIWSVDRQDWVPIGELEKGEQLQCTLPSLHFGRGNEGEVRCAQVLSVTVLQRATPVYNIEVHGEHVYQVGTLGVLVHNACPAPVRTGQGPFGYPSGTTIASAPIKAAAKLHKFAGQTVEQILRTKKGSIKNADLPEGSPSWSSIMKMSWEQIEAAAKSKQAGFQTIKKLLTDGRFDR